MAARRTERFTDHAIIARHASRVRPIRPRAAPTAINTVPSGAALSCMYGAFAIGGTVTIAAAVVEEEEEDVVVVETDDVDVLVSEVVEVSDEVVVVSMVVLVDDEEVVLVVLSEVDVDVDVDEDEVSVVVAAVVLVLSVVEGSSVVLAASVVSVDVLSAGTAAT